MKTCLLGAVSYCSITFVSHSADAALILGLGGQPVYFDDHDILPESRMRTSQQATPLVLMASPLMERLLGITASSWVAAMNTDCRTGWLSFNDWRAPRRPRRS